jgi:hypothetical protein
MYDIAANPSSQICATGRRIAALPPPIITVMKWVHARERRTRERARRGRLRPPPRPVRKLTRPTRLDPPEAKKAGEQR